jgi:UPF0271 protein
MAEAVARAVHAVDASLVLFGLSGSQLIVAGERAGLRVASEAFPDRGYSADGSLMPRSAGGAVITSPEQVAARAVAMAAGTVTTTDGLVVRVKADTLCIHGDTPGAAAMARAVRDALTAAGITVAAPGRAGEGPAT